jgi:excisionase family DNA binding protein
MYSRTMPKRKRPADHGPHQHLDKLLTVEELADILSVKESTIYQWTHQGFIPHTKLGRLVRFRESDVIKWLAKRSRPGRRTRKIDIETLGLDRQKRK